MNYANHPGKGSTPCNKNLFLNQCAIRNSVSYICLFILDGWGYTDHIDLWNGSKMRGGDLNYFSVGKEIWLWELV